jgi:hypothetical protein
MTFTNWGRYPESRDNFALKIIDLLAFWKPCPGLLYPG